MNERKICKGCFNSFSPKDGRLQYCSKYCQKLVNWEWREARMLDTGATEKQLAKHRQYHPKYPKQRMMSKSDKADIESYEKTMKELREERKRAGDSEPIDLDELIKRDKGVCHLCGGKVSKRRRKPRGKSWVADSDYPTVDHVIPLSRDGEHVWSNVKLAHWSCNRRKGGRIVAELKSKQQVATS